MLVTMLAFAQSAPFLPPPIPPGLSPCASPPGLTLTVTLGKSRRDGSPTLEGAIANASTIPYAVWHCPYANVRWFARLATGGPILTQPDWTKDFPSLTRDGNYPFGLLQGDRETFGYGPPKWMASLPKGRYQVWMLYRELDFDLNPASLHPLPPFRFGVQVPPFAPNTPWRSPAMQLVSNVVELDLPPTAPPR